MCTLLVARCSSLGREKRTQAECNKGFHVQPYTIVKVLYQFLLPKDIPALFVELKRIAKYDN